MLSNCGAGGFLRALWTARRLSQSILKEINPEYSLEGLILKLQYFGHLMQKADSLELALMLGKIEGRRRRWQRMRWLDDITNAMGMSLNKLRDREGQGILACCSPLGCSQTRLSDWAATALLHSALLLVELSLQCNRIFKLVGEHVCGSCPALETVTPGGERRQLYIFRMGWAGGGGGAVKGEPITIILTPSFCRSSQASFWLLFFHVKGRLWHSIWFCWSVVLVLFWVFLSPKLCVSLYLNQLFWADFLR